MLINSTAGSVGGPLSSVWQGIIYKIDTSNTVTALHYFGEDTKDPGRVPQGLLHEDSAGNLYGTTILGIPPIGSTITNQPIVYKLANDGVYSVLHQFDDNTVVNGFPWVNPKEVIPAADGNLYGTTYYGGLNEFGVFYSIDATGTYTVLHDFTANEGHPGNLILGGNGNFYLPTSDTNNITNFGSIYKISLGSTNPTPTNNPPVAVNDVYTIKSKGKSSVLINAPGVLMNDSDVDGDKLAVVGATTSMPRKIILACGKIELYRHGRIIFKQKQGRCKTTVTRFQYQVTDGKDVSNKATVAFTEKK